MPHHPNMEISLPRTPPARKISMVTYGADVVEDADPGIPRAYGLEPNGYLTLICRPIPENPILELVSGFSARTRGVKLAVLGRYTPDTDPYHRRVVDAASDEVVFLGSIYEPAVVAALRFHSRLYLHGHTVGGTNPPLVEAMAAGNPVIAHDNSYNRWTVGEAGMYFTTADDVDELLATVLEASDLLAKMRMCARERHAAEFTWEYVAMQYETILSRYAGSGDTE
jgi:glycosyltransferase involved in cell wall biosynthesis